MDTKLSLIRLILYLWTHKKWITFGNFSGREKIEDELAELGHLDGGDWRKHHDIKKEGSSEEKAKYDFFLFPNLRGFRVSILV